MEDKEEGVRGIQKRYILVDTGQSTLDGVGFAGPGGAEIRYTCKRAAR
jgi:hypothetical protein